MPTRYDYQKNAILYVDDEQKSLKYFRDIFGGKFRVLTAENAQEGFEILKKDVNGVGIVMSDQRMPGEKGVPFLSRVREFNHKILRILVTAYSDLETAVDSVNTGAVYKYITKPWDLPLLDATLLRGMEFFLVQTERDQLLEEKLAALHRLMITDRVVSLGVLAAGLSHHLRHVVPAVQSFMDVSPPHLEAELTDLANLQYPEAWRRYYDRVQGQMGQIQNILNDMGHAAKAFLPSFNDQVQPHTALVKAVERAKTRLAARNIKVVNNIPKNLPALKADARLYDRMMDALLEEAVQTLPVGGILMMDGVKESDQVVRLQLSAGDGGFQVENLHWIFDPFVTLPENGPRPGLQLLAAFLVVYHHGGVVHGAKESGKGQVFRFHFPVDPDQMVMTEGDRNFLSQMLFSESLWEKFLGHQP